MIPDLTVPEGTDGRETIQRLRQIAPDVSRGYSYVPIMANYLTYGLPGGVIAKPNRIEELLRCPQKTIQPARA